MIETKKDQTRVLRTTKKQAWRINNFGNIAKNASEIWNRLKLAISFFVCSFRKHVIKMYVIVSFWVYNSKECLLPNEFSEANLNFKLAAIHQKDLLQVLFCRLAIMHRKTLFETLLVSKQMKTKLVWNQVIYITRKLSHVKIMKPIIHCSFFFPKDRWFPDEMETISFLDRKLILMSLLSLHISQFKVIEAILKPSYPLIFFFLMKRLNLLTKRKQIFNLIGWENSSK